MYGSKPRKDPQVGAIFIQLLINTTKLVFVLEVVLKSSPSPSPRSLMVAICICIQHTLYLYLPDARFEMKVARASLSIPPCIIEGGGIFAG